MRSPDPMVPTATKTTPDPYLHPFSVRYQHRARHMPGPFFFFIVEMQLSGVNSALSLHDALPISRSPPAITAPRPVPPLALCEIGGRCRSVTGHCPRI